MVHPGAAEKLFRNRVVAALRKVHALVVAAAHVDADHHLRGLALDCLVDRVHIEVDQFFRVLAVRLDLVARRGVAQHGERDFVELHVAAAGAREVGDLGLVYLAEVGEEFDRVAVDPAIGVVGEAVQVHGRGRRHRDLDRAARNPLRELELIERDRLAAPHSALRIRRGEVGLVAVLVVKLEHGLLHHQAFGQADEFFPVGNAPELAVGRDLEAAVLLQADYIADRCVLRCAKGVFGELALGMLAECLPQFLRPQQTADVVGAERGTSVWLRAHCGFHGYRPIEL